MRQLLSALAASLTLKFSQMRMCCVSGLLLMFYFPSMRVFAPGGAHSNLVVDHFSRGGNVQEFHFCQMIEHDAAVEPEGALGTETSKLKEKFPGYISSSFTCPKKFYCILYDLFT